MSQVTSVWVMTFICDMNHSYIASRMSIVTYEWVMSHMNESCHIWMSHVTYEWVMSHLNHSDMYESCHVCMSHLQSSYHQVLFSHEWVMTYIRDMAHSHVISIWVMSHLGGSCFICMSHVTSKWVMLHLNESCHIWMSHVTFEWVTCKAPFNSRSSSYLTWIHQCHIMNTPSQYTYG